MKTVVNLYFLKLQAQLQLIKTCKTRGSSPRWQKATVDLRPTLSARSFNLVLGALETHLQFKSPYLRIPVKLSVFSLLKGFTMGIVMGMNDIIFKTHLVIHKKGMKKPLN